MNTPETPKRRGDPGRFTTIQIPAGGRKKDILSTIKETRLAKLYLKTLRQLSVFKSLDILLWRWGGARALLYLYKRISLRLALRHYPYGSKLSALRNSKDPSLLSRTTIIGGEETAIEPPRIYPENQAGLVPPLIFEKEFPTIQVHEVGHAWVYGGSNLTFTNSTVLCHDLYDFSRDFTSEELHGRHFYRRKTTSLFVILRDPTPIWLPTAAACLDACTQNYAHFMTEVLPRITLFCSEEDYADIPLIIDDHLHENILEAIAVVVGSSRKVYQLPIGRAVQCDRLLTISATGYVPFDQRNQRLSNERQGQFSPSALQQLRARLAPLTQPLPADQSAPKKIYIQRDSSVRKLTNTPQLEAILLQHGFVLIDPGKLSFHEQVRLFARAEVVIGPTGAALANAIFCQPGTEVGILMATHKHMIYKYWPAMLSPLKIRVSYLLGTIVANPSRGIHGDFYVDESALRAFISDCEGR